MLSEMLGQAAIPVRVDYIRRLAAEPVSHIRIARMASQFASDRAAPVVATKAGQVEAGEDLEDLQNGG